MLARNRNRNRNRYRSRCLAVTTAIGLQMAAPALAMTLTEALDAARTNDPQYRAAAFELDAARQGLPIARSVLLPSLQLSMSSSEVTGQRTFPNALNQDVTARVDYNAPQSTLSLRQPLLNLEGIHRYRQAEAVGRAAEATFRQRGLMLVDRVGTVYAQTLIARAALSVSDGEIASAQAQLTRAEQRLRRGEGTRIDEAQAKAGVELARTRQVDARDGFDIALTRLRRMVGQPVPVLRELEADYRPGDSSLEPLQHWLDRANDSSPVLQARREAIAAARSMVQRNVAGHFPRVDLVANLSRSRNESLSNLNQSSTLKSVGVQLNVPLFSGGAVVAAVRQSEADLARTEQEFRAEVETVELEVQRSYVLVASGAARIDAYRQLVAANETAVVGMTRALESGLATSADVIEAQSRLYGSLRDGVQARYEYLVARMRLLINVGLPMQEIIDDIDRRLTVKTELSVAALPEAAPRSKP